MTSNQVHWTANAMDAELRLTQQTTGNGLVTTSGFDALTGRLTSIATGSGFAVQNLSLTYDQRGNPLSRSDANTNLSETFSYDALNRLTASTVNLTPTPLSKTFSYDPIGNLRSKSDVGTYTYPAAGQPQPNAVTSISAGSISTTFTYDLNGNQTSGLGRTIAWTSYNKPANITQGTRTISFIDDTEHQRFKQVTPEETKLYLSAFGVSAEVTNPGTSSQIWTDYLSVGDPIVGMRTIQTASETVTTRYFHTDHLGSISVITNEAGAVVERLSYDAWGKRRNPNGTDDTTGSITSQSSRGFTGEEHLSVSSLVHLSGRVYDPIVARMTSSDPNVPRPLSTQSWNRYSYASNRPLRNVDPSGFQDLPAISVYAPCYCGSGSGSISVGYGSLSGSSSGLDFSYIYNPLPPPTMPTLIAPAPPPPVVNLFPALAQDPYFYITLPQPSIQAQTPSLPISGSDNKPFPAPLSFPVAQADPPNPGFLRKAAEGVWGCAMDIGCQLSIGDLPGATLLAGGKLVGAVGAGIGRLGTKGWDALRGATTEVSITRGATKYSANQLKVGLSQSQAIENLAASGFTKSISKDGVATVMTKENRTYRFYPSSTGGGIKNVEAGVPSASLSIDGRVVTKLRFRGE